MAIQVTREQYDAAMEAVIDAVTGGESLPRQDWIEYRSAVLAFAEALGIEVVPAPPARQDQDVNTWVERTWIDVRQGDTVRMPGMQSSAVVTRCGPVNHWHVNDVPPAGMSDEQRERFARDVQFHPENHRAEWSSIPVTLEVGSGQTYTPDHGMRPDAPVEILTTAGELAAIEALGGWHNRLR